jgi:hypothetical protein
MITPVIWFPDCATHAIDSREIFTASVQPALAGHIGDISDHAWAVVSNLDVPLLIHLARTDTVRVDSRHQKMPGTRSGRGQNQGG